METVPPKTLSSRTTSEKTVFRLILSAPPASRDAVHLAFASAGFGEMRDGAAPARGFPVSFLESGLVRFDVRAGIPASDRHSLQLGVRSDHLPRPATAAARR
jgi:hypothetical protein